jgi:polyisoprenoid-binding protein YceI
MRKVVPVTIAIALLGSASLVAQEMSAQPGKNDTKLISGGTYSIDPSHTQVLFSYNHMGFTPNMGLIAKPGSGALVLDPKKPGEAKVSVEFPVTNVRTGIAALDEHLMKPEFFDATKFPAAKFESTSVKVNGTSADITGNLTIKGITKPITLTATFVGAGFNSFMKKETVGFSAVGDVKRSDFGLGYGVPMVGDAVQLKIVAAFEK